MANVELIRPLFWALGLSLAACAAVILPTAVQADEPPPQAEPHALHEHPTFGQIRGFDSRFDRLIPKDAKLEKLAEGFVWSEGPVWIRDGGYLLFSDIPRNRIMKWHADKLSVFLEPSGYFEMKEKPRGGETGSNALITDAQGRIVMCQHGARRIARLEKDGTQTVLADRYRGKRLNSPNDLIYKSNGDLYFTDPPYGLEKNWDDPARELDFCGLFRLSADGKLEVMTKELARPNGLCFSPDEKTLYVANSDPNNPVWMAYPVEADGTLGKGRVFFDTTPWVKQNQPGLPDGMKADRDGNLFATGPGGLHVFSPDGTHLGVVDTGERTSNCNWGDDGSTLYITVHMYLARIKTTTKGNPGGPKK
ncbi:MAG TPA: SMP-30/gluconolactonase/LRE family protein [Pirellulales bacterium]|nr:SMP-30/gluconolactonase/LRE family protein [Pirellulales bacterium]